MAILIVESVISEGKALRSILLDHGYECLMVKGGNHGLKAVKESPIELIFVNLELRGMSGREFVKTLRREQVSIPVIGYGDENLADEELVNIGMRYMLQRPFSEAQVVGPANYLLGHKGVVLDNLKEPPVFTWMTKKDAA